MSHHDQVFKHLLREFFPSFLSAFVPDLHRDLDPRGIVFLDKELIQSKGGRRRTKLVDLVARVRLHGEPGFVLVHVEHESQHKRPIGRRLFFYAAWLMEQSGLPVYPILLTSYDQPRTAEPDRYMMVVRGLRVLDFRFRVVQLNRLNWRRFVRLKNPAATALMAKMNIQPADRVKVKVQILRLLATMRLDREKMDHIAGFVDKYLALSAKEEVALRKKLDKLPLGREKETVMELMTSWERKGRVEGRAEGRAEGREEERLALVKRLLAKQVGPMHATLENRIDHLSGERLGELAEALLDFNAVEDLQRWLAGRRKSTTPA